MTSSPSNPRPGGPPTSATEDSGASHKIEDGVDTNAWDRSRSGSIEENDARDDDNRDEEYVPEDDDEEDEDFRRGEEDGRGALKHEDEEILREEPHLSSRRRPTRERNGGPPEVITGISVEDLLKPDTRPNGMIVATARTLASRVHELPPGVGYGARKTVIRIGDEEAAFVLGRQGRTKAKIGRVSGCRVNLTNNLDLELIGSPQARARAELYVKLVVQQRRGPVIIDFDEKDRDDLTIVDVPTNCVAFVTGQQGHVLRSIEEEWVTLMFFVRHIQDLEKQESHESTPPPTRESAPAASPTATGAATSELSTTDGVEDNAAGDQSNKLSPMMKTEGDCTAPPTEDHDYSVPPKEGDSRMSVIDVNDFARRITSCEKLLIFGEERGRRGAELKVMSAVEQKNPRRFSSLFTPEYRSEKPGFDTDRTLIGKDDFSYALGKDGATRRKLAKASHCILEYIGRIAFIAGTMEERRRCREYLGWLIQQRTSNIHVDTTNRTDVTTIVVPKHLLQAVAGPRGTTLKRLEGTNPTFCFIDAEPPNANEERLLIFSHSLKARELARQTLYDAMDKYCAQRAILREKVMAKNEYVYQDPTERPPSNGRRSRRQRNDRKRSAQKLSTSFDGPLQPHRQQPVDMPPPRQPMPANNNANRQPPPQQNNARMYHGRHNSYPSSRNGGSFNHNGYMRSSSPPRNEPFQSGPPPKRRRHNMSSRSDY